MLGGLFVLKKPSEGLLLSYFLRATRVLLKAECFPSFEGPQGSFCRLGARLLVKDHKGPSEGWVLAFL